MIRLQLNPYYHISKHLCARIKCKTKKMKKNNKFRMFETIRKCTAFNRFTRVHAAYI